MDKLIKSVNYFCVAIVSMLLLPLSAQQRLLMDEQTPQTVLISKADKPDTDGLTNHYVALCYHDIRDDVAQYSDPDRYAFSTAELARQFEWMATNGYHPVSLEQIIAADNGGKPLPENAILLSFDDGYRSFYTHIYPLLKAYNYPAVYALVTDWVDLDKNKKIDVGHAKLTHKDFLTWQQVSEMAKSGLIEFSSHTHDMHKGMIANKEGNIEPAAVVPKYFSKTQSYESAEQYKQRVYADLKKSSDLIYRHTGKRPRAITWPYGRFTRVGYNIAKSLGMDFSLTLVNEEANHVSERSKVQRILLGKNVPTSDFIYQIVERQKSTLSKKGKTFDYYQQKFEPQRIVRIDLDAIYDADPAVVDKRLSTLLDRVQRMKVATIYLQAFSDEDGDGVAESLYFLNDHLPVKADLFNRVSWQIKTRTDTDVYGWLPISAFALPDKALQRQLQAPASDGQAPGQLDITRPKARTIIGDIYRSLAFCSEIDGIFFYDASTFGKTQGQSLDAGESTDAIIDFTQTLADIYKSYRVKAKTAIGLSVNTVLTPDSEQPLTKDFAKFLGHYDYTMVIGAAASDSKQQLVDLINAVKIYPNGLAKSIFELRAVNGKTSGYVDSEALADKMQLLLEKGVPNFGYYPDDFMRGVPVLSVVRPKLSLSTAPFRK